MGESSEACIIAPEFTTAARYRDALAVLTLSELVTLVHARLPGIDARRRFDESVKDLTREEAIHVASTRLAHVEMAHTIAERMRPQRYEIPPLPMEGETLDVALRDTEPPPASEARVIPQEHRRVVSVDTYLADAPTQRRLPAHRPRQLVNDSRLTAVPLTNAGRYNLVKR